MTTALKPADDLLVHIAPSLLVSQSVVVASSWWRWSATSTITEKEWNLLCAASMADEERSEGFERSSFLSCETNCQSICLHLRMCREISRIVNKKCSNDTQISFPWRTLPMMTTPDCGVPVSGSERGARAPPSQYDSPYFFCPSEPRQGWMPALLPTSSNS